MQRQLLDERVRPDDIADAPARHRIALREREDADHTIGVRQHGRRRVGPLEDEFVVCLIGDDPEVVTFGDVEHCGQMIRRFYCPGRVARGVHDDRLRARRYRRLHADRVDSPICVRSRWVSHRPGVDDVRHGSVVGPARVGDQDLVAGIGQQQQGRVEPATRTGRDTHLVGGGADAVPLPDLVDDGLPELRYALTWGVAGGAVVRGGGRGIDDVSGSDEVRIAAHQEQHVWHVAGELEHPPDAGVRRLKNGGSQLRHSLPLEPPDQSAAAPEGCARASTRTRRSAWRSGAHPPTPQLAAAHRPCG